MRRTRWIGAALIVLLAGACGDDDDDAAPVGTTAAGAQTDDTAGTTSQGDTTTTAAVIEPADSECTEDRAGGELTMGMYIFTAGLDPATNSGSGVTGATELGAIYDTLMRWDPDTGEFVPHLAESLEPNADASEWTLTLREGVTFSNGDPFDADAVIGSVERLGPQSFQQGYLRSFISGMEAPDDRTVVFTLSEPWGAFAYFLASEGGLIVNPAVAEARGDDLATNPEGAGAGPFVLERFAPGEEIVMTPNPTYWGGPVCLDRLRFVSILGSAGTYDAFQAGELDVAFLREAAPIAEAEADGVSFYRSINGFSGTLLINHAEGRPGTSLDLRLAIAHALDLDLINDRVNGGTGLMASSIMHPDALISPGVAGPTYDAELAREHVEAAKAAGWDGTLDLICSDIPREVEVSITVEALLEAVGIDVTVTNTTTQDKIRRVNVEHDFEIACYGLSAESSGPYPPLSGQLESDSPFSISGYGSPEMDAAMAQLRAAGALDELRDAMAEVQGVWNEQMPHVNYQNLVDFLVWDDDVHGLVFTRNAQVMFQDAYVEG